MDQPEGEAVHPSSGAGTFKPPLGFQKASEVLKAGPSTSFLPGPSSNRNGSNGTPSAITGDVFSSNSNAEISGTAAAVAETPAEPVKAVTITKPINRPATSKNAIVYNAVQRRNPVLQSIKNVGIEIGDIVADYQVGTHNGVLFLSLKYHRLHPEYIHQRIEKMKNMYNVRILLVLCDINEHQQSLREISKIAIVNNYTTFVAWSNEEVAQYLTTFKAFEHKSDESLKEPIHQSYNEQFYHVITSGKKVNKTDADNLAAQFGSFANIVKTSSKVLSTVKGLGATKVTSLIDAFNKPFLVGGLKRDQEDVTPVVLGDTSEIQVDMSEETEGIAEATAGLGSPDWPETPEEDEEEPVRSRARMPSPSRSPGVSPEPRMSDAGVRQRPIARVWHDPLDDDDDDAEEDELREPEAKRPRTSL